MAPPGRAIRPLPPPSRGVPVAARCGDPSQTRSRPHGFRSASIRLNPWGVADGPSPITHRGSATARWRLPPPITPHGATRMQDGPIPSTSLPRCSTMPGPDHHENVVRHVTVHPSAPLRSPSRSSDSPPSWPSAATRGGGSESSTGRNAPPPPSREDRDVETFCGARDSPVPFDRTHRPAATVEPPSEQAFTIKAYRLGCAAFIRGRLAPHGDVDRARGRRREWAGQAPDLRGSAVGMPFDEGLSLDLCNRQSLPQAGRLDDALDAVRARDLAAFAGSSTKPFVTSHESARLCLNHHRGS